MIATSRFVFLHLHKSGGTFVNEWLLRFFPDARPIGYHLPRREIPAESSGLPVLGLVRNPWSYYVSWYAFQARKAEKNMLFRVLSDEGRLDFDGTIRTMLALGSGSDQLAAIVSALPASYTNRGLNLPGPALAEIEGTGLGFYSFLYHYMYAGGGEPRIVTMETMREDLPGAVESMSVSLKPEAIAYLAAAPARNSSEHRPYQDYYGPELRGLVAQRDGELIERFRYRFGQ
jgi:hypothetical protein